MSFFLLLAALSAIQRVAVFICGGYAPTWRNAVLYGDAMEVLLALAVVEYAWDLAHGPRKHFRPSRRLWLGAGAAWLLFIGMLGLLPTAGVGTPLDLYFIAVGFEVTALQITRTAIVYVLLLRIL